MLEEVDGKDESDGQQRFITVDDLGNVDQPAREETGEEDREPEDQTAETDHCHTPEDSQIVKFFPVGPTAVVGPRAPSKEPLDGGRKIPDVLPVKPQGIFAEDKLGHG